MLDNFNNRILLFLEKKNWTVATVYWRVIGRHIKPY